MHRLEDLLLNCNKQNSVLLVWAYKYKPVEKNQESKNKPEFYSQLI